MWQLANSSVTQLQWKPPYYTLNQESDIQVDPHVTQYTVYTVDAYTNRTLRIMNMIETSINYSIHARWWMLSHIPSLSLECWWREWASTREHTSRYTQTIGFMNWLTKPRHLQRVSLQFKIFNIALHTILIVVLLLNFTTVPRGITAESITVAVTSSRTLCFVQPHWCEFSCEFSLID